jgi:vancomycin permeability regulator SanA
MRWLWKIALVALLVPIIFLAWTLGDVWQTSKRDQRSKTDAIVVMGAAQYDGRPSPLFKVRLDHAHALYTDKVAPLIVVLGGKRTGDRFTEAEAGAAYLEEKLPAHRVTGVKGGSTTLDSLRRFTGLAEERKINSIVIVSDPMHLARAEEMAEDFGFDATVSRARLNENSEKARASLIRETANLAYYRVFKKDARDR